MTMTLNQRPLRDDMPVGKILPPPPGIYPGTSMRTYLSWDCLNKSSLLKMRKSPFDFWYWWYHDKPGTGAQAEGTIKHTACWEPEKFDSEYPVFPGPKRSGKPWTNFKLEHTDKDPSFLLLPHEAERYKRIGEHFRANQDVAQLMAGDGRMEVAVVWIDEETGLVCKCRVDYLSGVMPADLKNFGGKGGKPLTPYNFEWYCWEYGVYYQGGMMMNGLTTVTGKVHDYFHVIVMDGSEPWEIVSRPLHDGAAAQGEYEFHEHLRTFVKCRESGVWPGLSDIFPSAFNIPDKKYSNDHDTVFYEKESRHERPDTDADTGDTGTDDAERRDMEW